jgi:hypothetical protein
MISRYPKILGKVMNKIMKISLADYSCECQLGGDSRRVKLSIAGFACGAKPNRIALRNGWRSEPNSFLRMLFATRSSRSMSKKRYETEQAALLTTPLCRVRDNPSRKARHKELQSGESWGGGLPPSQSSTSFFLTKK